MRYKHVYVVVVQIHVYTASFFLDGRGRGATWTFIEVLESVMKQVQMNQLKYG